MTDPKPTSIPAITAEDLADSPFVSADGATSTDSATTVSDGTESAGAAPEPTATTPVPFPDETEPTQEASGTIISTDPVSTEPELAPTDGADVDPTVSTALSSETPSTDETVDTGATPASTDTSSTDAEEPTPIFNSTVEETGTDPSMSSDSSETTSSDSSTSPETASTPTSPATTSPEGDASDPSTATSESAPTEAGSASSNGVDDSAETSAGAPESGSPATPSNSAGEGDPTGTGTVIGKDGAGPTETQPSIPLDQPDGSTLNTGPGVPSDVSLSPTAAGGFTSDEDEGPLSTDPVFTEPEEPEEEPAPVRSFGTPIDPTFEAAVTGYTPRFRAVLRPNGVIEVQRTDWIGPEVLTVDVDDVDELTGLLQGLAAKQD